MEENNIQEPKSGGYKVENVILIESSFNREISFTSKDNSVANEIVINHEAFETSMDNKFGVTLILDYNGRQDDKVLCKAKIKMLGIFEKIGEPPLGEDIFKKINAPAVIYPFIREHLNSICLKAGITNVFLPTVNFKL